jgi:hypothetical protein
MLCETQLESNTGNGLPDAALLAYTTQGNPTKLFHMQTSTHREW